ncbi:MAG: hypothetical protein U0264_17825 [Candidatus Kapaibacterium sp.]
MRSQYFSKDELKNIQIEKLKYIIQEAILNVPFYQSLKSKINFDSFSLEELTKFPIVNKDIIRNNLDLFISKKVNKKTAQWSHTSGSSGKPFHFIVPNNSDSIENIVAARAWSMGNSYEYHPGDPVISLRSYAPKDGQSLLRRKGNYWYLSAFDMNNKNLNYYLNTIEASGAKIIRGYASSLYIFTLLLKENNIKINQVKTLVTSSESCLPQYRKVIEDHWGIKVLDWYGQNERTVTVQQCSYGNYHNNDEYGIIELDENNQIIATSLINAAMPFIRYGTSDIAVRLDTNIGQCPCKRNLSIPFKEIDGRSDDILIKLDNTKIPTANIYTAMQVFEKIKQFQITQQVDKSLVIKLVGYSTISDTDIQQIKQSLALRVGELHMAFETVDVIERSRLTGKIKAIETLIK